MQIAQIQLRIHYCTPCSDAISGPKNRVCEIKSGHDFCRYRNSIQVIYFQINDLVEFSAFLRPRPAYIHTLRNHIVISGHVTKNSSSIFLIVFQIDSLHNDFRKKLHLFKNTIKRKWECPVINHSLRLNEYRFSYFLLLLYAAKISNLIDTHCAMWRHTLCYLHIG